MTRDEFHAAAMALPGSTMDVQWGDDHIYKVGGKMFAGVDGVSKLLAEYAHEPPRDGRLARRGVADDAEDHGAGRSPLAGLNRHRHAAARSGSACPSSSNTLLFRMSPASIRASISRVGSIPVRTAS